jgi:hypothetical protein
MFSNHTVDKAVALSILLLLVSLVLVFITEVYLDHFVQIEEEIDLNRKKAGRVDSILTKEAEYQKAILSYQRNKQSKQIFLKASNASTASSELQNKTKGLISRYTKAKIQTIKPYPVVQHDNYSEVAIEIRMRDITHSEVRDMLFQVESQLPLIMVSELEIVRTQLQYKSLVAKKGPQHSLNATMVLSAFFRGSGAAS